MAKKSHRIASRQAAVGKERKRKKKAQGGEKKTVSYTAPPPPADAEVADNTLTETVPEVVSAPAVARPARTVLQDSDRYQYVIADLRHIAIIAVPLLVLLIILALVL
jgi:hypothetical protein